MNDTIPLNDMQKINPIDAQPISFSGLKQFAKSPAHFVHYKTSEYTSSPAMRRGSLVHRMILEPETMGSLITIDASTRSTKAFKEAESIHGEAAVLQKEMDEAAAIAEAVRNHKTASELLERASTKEEHLHWECEGLKMHGFPDAYGNGVLLDLKVTNPEPSKFQRMVMDAQYHMQLALYGMAIAGENFANELELYWIAVDPNQPHTVCVYQASDAMVLDGVNTARLEARMFLNWCNTYCEDAPLLGFDHYDQGAAVTLDLPKWHK